MPGKPPLRTFTCVYTAPTAGLSRGEQAYGELKRRLLLGEFALGARLGEERLASLVGVSRTPVREALSRLHVEGFIERLPDGGYGPTAPDLPAVRQLYEVRRGLELVALRRPLEGGPSHDTAQLEALLEDWRSIEAPVPDGQPDPWFVMLDEDFHVRLAAAAGNGELAALLQSINERIRLVRIHDFLSTERITATIAQHAGIVEALLLAGPAVAVERLDAHLSESLEVVEQRAAAALSRMVAAQLRSPTGPPLLARPERPWELTGRPERPWELTGRPERPSERTGSDHDPTSPTV
jgi:DNA-binding GntR family transcriptional regulator